MLNKFHVRYESQYGGQTVFSRAEENTFVNGIAKTSDWDLPLNQELKIFVQAITENIVNYI